MFVIVVGGGKVGYHLSRELLGLGNEVVLMESDHERAAKLRADFGSLVLTKDGSEGRWLKFAGVTRADLVVAVTGDDEDNLVVCQLTNMLSKNKARTLARINNPNNAAVFRKLGVNETVSATDLILSMIEKDVEDAGAVVHLMRLEESGLELVEYRVYEDSRVAGKRLGELDLPSYGCNLCTVIRGAEALFPDSRLIVETGDMLVALVQLDSAERAREFIVEPEIKVEMT